MQLILAIDTDRRQVSQLTALVKALAVDFVHASSAGEALQTLGERVPDLILTPALLSPFDDGVLAEYLRDLGPAGAHVQTLQIPVLGPPATKGSRWTSLFRRSRSAPTSAPGCDPNVFAEEIKLYLSRAALARQATDALVGRDQRSGGAAPAAWDIDSRRAQEPLRTLSDPDAGDTSTWQDASEWQAMVVPAAPCIDEPDGEASEWDVADPAVADDPPVIREAPVTTGATDLEAIETCAAVDAPPLSTGADSPSFEAALAAIRAAWEPPKSRARTDQPGRGRAVSS